MKLNLHYYDVYPKVVLVDRPEVITIKPLGAHAAFYGGYRLEVMNMSDGKYHLYPENGNMAVYDITVCEDGCLRLSHTFRKEDEHLIRIIRDGKTVADLSVYALDRDMAGRYPYRGDLHMHTFRSDGSQAPAIVAANYRKNGYDFMVISDHNRYYPSLEAQDTYADVPLSFNIVRGEEVHLPGNDIHIVNFGGKYSVNGLLEHSPQNRESDRRAVIQDPPAMLTEEEYRSQVNALIPQLSIPENVHAFSYAACVWIFEHIRKAQGLGIFCHPYWRVGPYQVPDAFLRFMTEQHPFDAFEVLGGERYYEHNGFQTIHYYEDLARGIRYPIVGSTDSHNSLPEHSQGAMICSTFVFAKENTDESIIEAIKQEYSVAIDTISKEYRLVGSLRLAKYSRFLLDEVTPLHDELCFEEGRLMKLHATGDPDGADGLRFLAGRMERFYQKYFHMS